MCGAGMAIGSGVAMNSTASAIPPAIASMTCRPTVSGVIITVSGDGGGVYGCVIAEAVVADAGAAAQIDDPSPKGTAAINEITAQPRDRITRTRESCPKKRLRHSGKRRTVTAQARSSFSPGKLPLNRRINFDALPASPQVFLATAPHGDRRRVGVDAVVATQRLV